jgi:hypothetical protein
MKRALLLLLMSLAAGCPPRGPFDDGGAYKDALYRSHDALVAYRAAHPDCPWWPPEGVAATHSGDSSSCPACIRSLAAHARYMEGR